MNFREASEVAKQHAGAVISRDSSGTFIVRLDKHTVIAATPTVDDAVFKQLQECEKELEQLRRLHEGSTGRENILSTRADRLKRNLDTAEDANTTLKCEAANLKSEAAKLKSEVANLVEVVENLRRQHTAFQNKLAKVSQDEWTRISQAEEQTRRAEAAARYGARVNVKCQCLGEVENCVRCSGSGAYMTDGFGNRL